MKKRSSMVIGAVCLAAIGCSSEFWKGGATGRRWESLEPAQGMNFALDNNSKNSKRITTY